LPVSKTIVMSCAGSGSRLGLGCTKALVKVCGEPLIHWNLAMLKNYEDVVCVVGFQAEEVIATVCAVRSDVTFVFNHDFATTGTAASLAMGSRWKTGSIVSLDGDLLVHPTDFAGFVEASEPTIGICEPLSADPVFVDCYQNDEGLWAKQFSRTVFGTGAYEWTGLVNISASRIQASDARGDAKHHVYEMMEREMPMKAKLVRCREIDTPEDHREAEAWLRPIQGQWEMVHGKA
jgi:choline kinase